MMAVVTHPSMSSCLTKLPTRSAGEQLQLWTTQKRQHQKITSLITSLGKPSITSAQAKKLDSVGLSYNGLVSLFGNASDQEGFYEVMKSKNVNSKALQKKLWTLLSAKCRQS